MTDPRLQPTPDYGTMGLGSDISRLDPMQSTRPPVPKSGLRFAQLIAVVLGTVAARADVLDSLKVLGKDEVIAAAAGFGLPFTEAAVSDGKPLPGPGVLKLVT